MPLNEIVNVQITRDTQTVSQAGFGTLNVMGTNKKFNERIKYYSSVAEVALDFNANDPEYIAAQDVFSQSPSPIRIAISRRSADTSVIRVITSLEGFDYVTTINGVQVLVNSTSAFSQSTIELDSELDTDNLINLSLNGTIVGTVTSIIDFDIDFDTSNETTPQVNGVDLATITFVSDQATTIGLIATEIQNNGSDVLTATVTDTRQITVVFTTEGNNTVNACPTINGATQPVATISEGGFFFDTSHLQTMTNISDALELLPNVAEAPISGLNDLILTVLGDPNTDTIIDFFTVTLGSSQPVATITTIPQPPTFEILAIRIAEAINLAGLGVTASPDTDGTVTITANVSNVPYTLTTTTDIINPNRAVVTVTQVEPTQTYVITIDGQDFSYTAPVDVESSEEIASALIDLINAGTTDVSAGFNTDVMESTVSLDANLVLGNKIDVVVNGNPIAQIDFTTSHLNTMNLIASAIEAEPNIEEVTVSGANNRVLTVRSSKDFNGIINSFVVTIGSVPTVIIDDEPQASGEILILSNDPIDDFILRTTPNILSISQGLIVDPLSPSDTVENDLDAIEASNSDWYALASISRDFQTVLSIASWVEARVKLFGTTSSDPNIINLSASDDNSSIAYELYSSGFVRTFLMYHQDSDDDYPECAWFGRVLPLEPGSETWKFKTLNSISYSNLSTTQSLNARNKKANTYEFIGGVGITREGTISQGEFIDIIRGVDWLTARIQEFVYSVLVRNNKVPYTDSGIALIEAEVRRALELGISNDFIATTPQYTVTVPRASEVPPNDKANRVLNNVRFQATLAGAIHAVTINGTVSV